MAKLNVIPYQSKHHKYFRELSLEWLNKYDLYEDEDGYMLDNPDKLILDKEGVIYMAEVSGEIVGVIALTIVSNEIYEIHKLGVAGNYHGQGIGLKLMNHCLDYCKNKGAKKVVLETNTKLEDAMRLYHKLGFTEIAMIDVKYEKSNYKMELIF